MTFRAPKCPVCRRVQRASSALQHKNGNYACACNSVNYSEATQHRRDNPVKEQDCMELSQDGQVKLVILGEPAVKKNSMRIVSFGGHSSIRPSVLYEVWASKAIKQLQDQYIGLQPLKGKLHLEVKFYKGTSRPSDLSNLYEGVQDCLTTAGVWLDDTLVESHDGSRKLVDKSNPRVEIIIRRFHV